MASQNQPLGEVMSANICEFLVETFKDEKRKPAFGSFLKATNEETGIEVVGVVYDVITGPSDNQHRPVPMRLSRQQLRAQQPQIYALLKTELRVATCGFVRNSSSYSRLPPHPPSVHDFVYPMSKEEIEEFTTSLDFLRLVSSVQSVPSEELVAACIREAARARGGSMEYLVSAGRNLSCVFRDDYDRLLSVLRNIKPDSNER